MSLEHGSGDSFPRNIIAILAALIEGYWMDGGQLEETTTSRFERIAYVAVVRDLNNVYLEETRRGLRQFLTP